MVFLEELAFPFRFLRQPAHLEFHQDEQYLRHSQARLEEHHLSFCSSNNFLTANSTTWLLLRNLPVERDAIIFLTNSSSKLTLSLCFIQSKRLFRECFTPDVKIVSTTE